MIELNYNDFTWIKGNANKNGFNPLGYYVETEYYFDMRYYFEGVWYKTCVYKTDIPNLTSRNERQKRDIVAGVPENPLIAYTVKDIEWFKKEELFDYMRVISFLN